MATATRRARAVLGVVLAAMAVAVGLAACGGSQYHYVSSSTNHTYFKVPKDWKVFDKTDIIEASGNQLSSRQAARLRFMVAVDGDPDPSLAHHPETASEPFAIARVRELSDEERDEFNLLALRNELVPIDQILKEDVGQIELLAEPKDIKTADGFAGSRLVYRVTSGDGSFTVDQTGLVDPSTQVVYFFIIGCESTCYERNKRTISEVADSWTVKER